MRNVSLFGLDQAALIVPGSTGTSYTNQVGGYFCIQRTVEGTLVPLSCDPPLDGSRVPFWVRLSRYFARSGMVTPDADVVDSILALHPTTSFLRLDRTELARSCESWLVVSLDDPSADELISGFDVETAILTWPNSD